MKDLTQAIGREYETQETVTEALTASEMMSGSVPVYATPRMIAMMEFVCAKCLEPFQDPGECSVGTLVNVRHLSATPVGMTVQVSCRITAVEGRNITFEVKASDCKGPLGEGTHQRAIVTADRFIAKALTKLS